MTKAATRGRRRAPVLAALAAAALLAGAAPATAQGPPIAELERLAREREADIVRLEARLGRLEVQQDSLVSEKRRAASGSAAFGSLSNEILRVSNQIRPIQRDLRTRYDQVRSLRTELYQRYNVEIGAGYARIDALKRQGYTSRTSPELRQLLERLEEYVRGRQAVALALEVAEEEVRLHELVYSPTDTSQDLRKKEAYARDAIDWIDGRIAAIQRQIQDEVRNDRMRREAERLRQDIDLWGDDQSARSASEIEAMLEQRGPRGSRGSGADPFGEDPRERIRRYQARLIDLRDRREEYVRKAQQFADLLSEFYR